MAKLTRILSIDGGGIRGILPGMILVELENILQQKSGNPDARIADYFDLLAGTSTGGILTCIYLLPDKQNPARPKFTARNAVDLYLDKGGEIFDVGLLRRLLAGDGLLQEMYPVKNLEENLKHFCGDVWLSELLKPCLITAYDVTERKSVFFTKHDTAGGAKDFKVRHVARATSAAPSYFPAARIKSRTNQSFALVDGGVFANNPALCAYAEARASLKGHPSAKDMLILSIGTGNRKKSFKYNQVKNWGALMWAKPALDIMMSGVSETVDYQLAQIFDTLKSLSPKAPKQYLRIEPDLGRASAAMDDAEKANLRALKKAGEKSAQAHRKDLEKFADLLMQ